MKKWEELPENMKTEEVKYYYQIMQNKRGSLIAKRVFDFIISLMLLLVLSPVFLVLTIMIRIDSEGPVFFKQKRITQYGNSFYIYKFRTMVMDADKIGTSVTIEGDPRITKAGRVLRKTRLDEIPQLINVLKGEMTFVGARPEVEKYVRYYDPVMYATLLLPAGVTSKASIQFKDEAKMLDEVANVDEVYVEKILPIKMKYNLSEMEEFSLFNELKVLFLTVVAVIK